MLQRLAIFSLSVACVAADLASIQGVLNSVNFGLGALDTAVLGLGNTTSAQQLSGLGALAGPLLQNATSTIDQSAPLSLQDALSLNTSTAALRQNTNLTIQDFVAKIPYFNSLGMTAVVLQNLQADKNGSVALAQAILSKIPNATGLSVPAGIAGLGDTLNDLSTIFDQGIAAFSEATTIHTGIGVLNNDSSCDCAVICPAGSFATDTSAMRYL